MGDAARIDVFVRRRRRRRNRARGVVAESMACSTRLYVLYPAVFALPGCICSTRLYLLYPAVFALPGH